MAAMFSIPAKPYAFEFPAASTALLLIDMQRDFLLEGGFGDIQGVSYIVAQDPAKEGMY